jgi:hypothetical protein
VSTFSVARVIPPSGYGVAMDLTWLAGKLRLIADRIDYAGTVLQ